MFVLCQCAKSGTYFAYSKSSTSGVKSGVPQGSVLEPIPFFYVNDIREFVNFVTKLFADDTKCSKITFPRDCQELRHRQNIRLDKCTVWLMEIGNILLVTNKKHYKDGNNTIPLEK